MRRLIAIAIAALVFGAPSGVAAYQKMWPQASGGERRRGLKRASAQVCLRCRFFVVNSVTYTGAFTHCDGPPFCWDVEPR